MRWRIGLVLLLLVAGLAAWNYLRPIPAVAAAGSVLASETIAGTPPALPWPSRGWGAISAKNLVFIASSETEQPMPAASVTKVMTARVILTEKPLQKDQQGP